MIFPLARRIVAKLLHEARLTAHLREEVAQASHAAPCRLFEAEAPSWSGLPRLAFARLGLLTFGLFEARFHVINDLHGEQSVR